MRTTRTERGWGAHFICSSRCNFRRNTLLECGGIRIIVSTVGAMQNWVGDPRHDKGVKGFDSIGAGERMFETMAFHASFQAGYWDADVGRQCSFDSEWALCGKVEQLSDQKANDMHEKVVAEIMERLKAGDKFTTEETP